MRVIAVGIGALRAVPNIIIRNRIVSVEYVVKEMK